MISEANHYTTFLKFARQYGDDRKVDEKWQALLAYEANLMKTSGKKKPCTANCSADTIP